MRTVAFVVVALLANFAGCLMDASDPFQFRVKNQTDETHHYAIIVYAGPNEDKVELFRENIVVPAGQTYDGAAGRPICRDSLEGRLWHTFEVDGRGTSTIGLSRPRCAASIFTGYHDETRTGTTFE